MIWSLRKAMDESASRARKAMEDAARAERIKTMMDAIAAIHAPAAKPPTCETCRYWHPIEWHSSIGAGGGSCHRWPPHGAVDWPLTRRSDTCGEHAT